MKENNEKKMKDEDEISKLIKAFPKDIANPCSNVDNKFIITVAPQKLICPKGNT
jgi:hypothetical protein